MRIADAIFERIPDPVLNSVTDWAALAVALATLFAAVTGTIAYFGQIEISKRKDVAAAAQQRRSDEEIAKANAESAKANAVAAKASEGVALANREAAQANERAAEALKVAEMEKLARLKLEEKLSPRLIGEEQRNKMTDALASFSGQRIDLIRVGDSYESDNLCEQFKTLLTNAGWVVKGPWGAAGQRSGKGIALTISKEVKAYDKTDQAAVLLLEQIKGIGHMIAVGAQYDPEQTPFLIGPDWDKKDVAPIRLIVAEKP